MTMNNSTYSPSEVTPGSQDDPFSPNYVDPSQRGAVVVGGSEQAKPGATTQSAPATPQNVSSGTVQAPPATAPKAEPADKGGVDEVAERIKQLEETMKSRLAAQQSAADKQMAALQAQLKEAREASVRAERESKLSSEDLTDDEKALLRNKFLLEDKETELEEREEANEEFFRRIYIARTVSEYEQFGLTAEMLESLEEPEEMELLAQKTALEYYRSGNGQTIAQQLANPEPTQEKANVPAGAMAPSDLGGGAPVTPPAQLSTGTGRDAMLQSLNAIPWENLKYN